MVSVEIRTLQICLGNFFIRLPSGGLKSDMELDNSVFDYVNEVRGEVMS